jgi:uncharacterized LabA/DUF88 family protein
LTSNDFPKKTAILIDGGYYRELLKDLNLESLDIVRFSNVLAKPAYRLRTYFFDGKRTEEIQSFHDTLRFYDRFEVILGEVVPRIFECRNCGNKEHGHTQKSVDVALAVEMVHLASTNNVDKIVLVAGDLDFLPAIETAKHEGVIIKIVYREGSISEKLKKAADERLELSIEYLKGTNIDFESVEKDETIPIDETSETEDPDLKKVLLSLPVGIEDILTETDEKIVSLQVLGEKLAKKVPKWKTNFPKLKLTHIIGNYSEKFEIVEKEKIMYCKLKETTVERTEEDFKQFLEETIKEYYSENDRELTVGYLGYLFVKKNPNWKKDYRIKHLKKKIDELEISLIKE